jgi:hypothetical protein
MGKPTISASCSARHAINRLLTEPNINASAMVSNKLLRRPRHCQSHNPRPITKAPACAIIWRF